MSKKGSPRYSLKHRRSDEIRCNVSFSTGVIKDIDEPEWSMATCGENAVPAVKAVT